MRVRRVLNGLFLSRYSFEPIGPRGEPAIEMARRRLGAGVDERVPVLVRDPALVAPLPWADAILLASSSVGDLLAAMESLADGYDAVLYAFADAPLILGDVVDRVLDVHERYVAEYTFADGYPLTTTPEVIASGLFARLRTLAGDDFGSVGRESIFEVISKDINAFDIETELADTDLRLLRLSLTTDTRAGFLLTQRIAAEDPTDEGTLTEILLRPDGTRRTLPSFVNIQVVDGCPQSCSYCPYAETYGDVTIRRSVMDVERFRALIDRIADFSPDAHVSLSLWGEVALHPDVSGLIAAIAAREGLHLLIETSGIGWSDEVLDSVVAVTGEIDWIVSLDAHTKRLYTTLRGEGWEEASQFPLRLLSRFGSDRVHVQAARMKENDGELEAFYNDWKARGVQVIIQKYDAFAGSLPDRTVVDLRPLERVPCRHLERDLTILIDGTVVWCREDVSGETAVGNAFQDDLDDLWRGLGRRYIDHQRENYGNMCERCDEYYTFNF